MKNVELLEVKTTALHEINHIEKVLKDNDLLDVLVPTTRKEVAQDLGQVTWQEALSIVSENLSISEVLEVYNDDEELGSAIVDNYNEYQKERILREILGSMSLTQKALIEILKDSKN